MDKIYCVLNEKKKYLENNECLPNREGGLTEEQILEMIYFKEELDFFAEKIRTIQKDIFTYKQKTIKLKKKIHALENKPI